TDGRHHRHVVAPERQLSPVRFTRRDRPSEPDGRERYVNTPLDGMLRHVYLAVIDPSLTGHQPIGLDEVGVALGGPGIAADEGVGAVHLTKLHRYQNGEVSAP